jgi:hypothetical protein
MSYDVDARPENSAVIAYLKPRGRPGTAASQSPDEVTRPYETLGAHPDLVMHLWDVLAKDLPTDARRVVYGHPALVRADSGVIFGLAIGTHVCALRLPVADRDAAVTLGATTTHRWGNGSVLDAKAFGAGWVIAGWAKDAAKWCRAAYDFAA